MPAPWSNLASKCEQAIATLLGAKSIGTSNIYTGKRAADKDAPCVIIHAESMVEDQLVRGNYTVKVTVSVKSIYAVAGDKSTDDTLVAKTFDELNSENLEADLSTTQADFTVFGIVGERTHSSGPEEDGDAWIESLTLNLYCAPSDIE